MTRAESGGGVISTLTTEVRGVAAAEERVGELKAELGAEEDTVFWDGLRSGNQDTFTKCTIRLVTIVGYFTLIMVEILFVLFVRFCLGE